MFTELSLLWSSVVLIVTFSQRRRGSRPRCGPSTQRSLPPPWHEGQYQVHVENNKKSIYDGSRLNFSCREKMKMNFQFLFIKLYIGSLTFDVPSLRLPRPDLLPLVKESQIVHFYGTGALSSSIIINWSQSLFVHKSNMECHGSSEKPQEFHSHFSLLRAKTHIFFLL